ncbi:hypothetical protein [Silvanigrella aquatica]|uniref:Fe2OG dioxygenase domain-containing protein n=1 Tax=Silvanigrella aquatica TaxID=1915309 RepID=A0A1L4CXS6_9BACT|nr:hypothetical protein [Silvanigrella aquatica]APJ02761.1 hypothetical protein AXG55_02005 [Silvanigrella aquatica]
MKILSDICIDYLSLRKNIDENGVINLTNYFSKSILSLLQNEIVEIFTKNKKRRDIYMRETDNTPRKMYTVSQKAIYESSDLIPAFYSSKDLNLLLNKITGKDISPVPVESGERFVINGLENAKDTHGWHWDDYTYALVFIAKAPSVEFGGYLEAIPNTLNEKNESNAFTAINNNKIDRHFYSEKNIYFMKSDTTLHRVTPINNENLRVSLAMAWATDKDLRLDLDHMTIKNLYGI